MTMGVGASADESVFARELFEKIDGSERQKYSVKVKTLMNQFGYDAERRVRQSSLDGVVDKLAEWGIVATFSSVSRSANDWVTLSRAARPPGPPPRPPGPGGRERAARNAAPKREVDGSFSPLHFAFRIDDAATETQSRAFADDIVDHLWSFRPVMLVVEGDESDLALAGAVAGAIMRRRALFLAGTDESVSCPSVPDVLTPEVLGRVLESTVVMTHAPGHVLLLRVDSDDPRSDRTLALARDVLVPHTYRLRARSERKVDGAFATWVSSFAGAPSRATDLTDKIAARPDLDVAALLTEAVQARDALLARACERGLPRHFTASNESTEHMAVKAGAFRDLSAEYGEGNVRLEQSFDGQASEDGDDGADAPRVLKQKCRPDIRVEGKKWVEVETLRGRGKQLRDPFFELERRLLKPVQFAPPAEEIIVLVPSDLAMLAGRRLEIVARNLQTARGANTAPVTWGFLDLESDAIVTVAVESTGAPQIEIRATSWRERRTPREKPRTWADVAGYRDLRERITADILDPLRDPGRYRRHGLKSASGLLLYGLPGCGKSLIGRVLAGEAGINCKILYPSDLTSMWLGEGTGKIREAFDWALDQEDGCLLVLDELDAVAPVRVEMNMHADEKRQVNELLVQLDRVHRSDKPIVIVGTTNYMRGIDGAVRRSGRFDVKIPVFPPDIEDRKALFRHFIGALEKIDVSDALGAIDALAETTSLFAPADIESIVMVAARRAIFAANAEQAPRLTEHLVRGIIRDHQRSITQAAADAWLEEARAEIGGREPTKLEVLRREIALAYGTTGAQR